MGDRYTMSLPCANCGEVDRDIWYAPNSGWDTFTCKSCGVVNDIVMEFTSRIHRSSAYEGYGDSDEFGKILI